MKKKLPFRRILLYVIFISTVIQITSCQKEFSQVPPPQPPPASANKPPIATAGADQKITLPKDSALLDGSASFDPDGSITSYKWVKIEGPVLSNFSSPDSSKTLVKSLAVGVYKFELTVKDNGALIAKDTIQFGSGHGIQCTIIFILI
jgi:cell division protein FtsI/penicillin-binding protein 2